MQFWDGQFGTFLQSNSYHKGDVNALAAAPSHNRVFSAGSDGKVRCSMYFEHWSKGVRLLYEKVLLSFGFQ